MRHVFIDHIDKLAREWWYTNPRGDIFPFTEPDRWESIPEASKWTIYGLYLDHLRGVGLSQSPNQKQ